MPKIVSTDFNLQTADTTSTTVSMPQPHATGDVFFCAAVKDSVTTAGPTTASTGWFQGMATSTSTGGTTTAGGLCSWFVKVATSGDEDPIVITNSDTDSVSIIIVAIRGCGVTKTITGYTWSAGSTTYTSTAHGFQVGNIVNITGMTPSAANGIFAVTAVAANTFTVVDADPTAYSSGGSANCIVDAHGGNGTIDSTGAPYGCPGVTTNFDKSLCLYTVFTGGSGCPVNYPGLHLVTAVDTGTEGLACGYMVKRTAGASGTFNFYTDAVNSNNLGVCVAFRDSATGYEMPYLDSDWATLVHPFRGSSTIITGDAWGTALTNYPTAGKCAVTEAYQVDQSGGPSYVSLTTNINSGADGDVTLYPATEASGAEGTGDWVCFGHTKPFYAIMIDSAGATAGVGGAVTWEYWNGVAWASLGSVTDGTTAFTAAAADGLLVRWTPPAQFNWETRVINGGASLFWVRARCTTVWSTNPTISQAYIGGAALVYDAVAGSTDAGVVQFENAANITGSINVSQISGTYIDLGQTVDLANKIVCGTFQFTLPRDYVDSARYKEGGGVHVFFADTSFNRKHWVVGNYLDEQTSDAQRNRFAIQWEQATDTTMSRTTTDPSDTIADVFIGNWARRGVGAVSFSHMVAVTPANTVVNGGSATYPISVSELIDLGDASPVQLFRDYQFMVPVTFGGSDAMHASLDDFTFTFPIIATSPATPYATAVYSQAHYDSGSLGFIFDARAGDTMEMTNGKITSPSTWQFTVTATASASAAWSFDGMLIINANVILRAVYTWDNIKWQNCPSFTTNGATITNNTFVNTKVTVASPAEATLISDSTFTSSGTGYAIEIGGSAGEVTLTDVTFTGYAGTNGTTGNEAIFVNIGSGAMTINIAGGSTPSIRTAGATVTVVNAVTVAVTAKDAADSSLISGARVLLYAEDGTVVTISRVSSTASVAHTAHGYLNGQKVIISGADQGEYNGTKTISNVSTNAYDYTVSGTPTTPATGTITSYRVILDDVTNGSGVLSDAGFAYVSDLDVLGRIRKASAAPLYKTAPLSGTITDAGLSLTAFLVGDA